MASFVTKPGSGSLFRNKEKTSENSPGWRGEIVTESGEKLAVAGWEKRTAKGELFISFKVQKPFQKKTEKPVLEDEDTDVAF